MISTNLAHRRLLGAARRLWSVAFALLLVLVSSQTAAYADTPLYSIKTWNRPTITEAGGAEYMAWAGTSAAGEVHVGILNSLGGLGASWYDGASSTWPGTGPAISSVAGQGVVVAWDDGATGNIMLAYLTGSGFTCVTYLQTGGRSDGTPQAISHDTPYLKSEGDDGAGQLLLAWVDSGRNALHITSIAVPTVAECGYPSYFTFQSNWTTNLAETSFNGPALAVSGYQGTSGSAGERFWLTWAGTNSGHSINIAEFTEPSLLYFQEVGKSTQSNRSTLTDMGAAYNSSTGEVVISYCSSGADHNVHYQQFTTTAGGAEISPQGSQCEVESSGSVYSGGVDVAYIYSWGTSVLAYNEYGNPYIEEQLL